MQLTSTFRVWGMSGTLGVQRADQLEFATERLQFWLDAVDESCSRFREDSEISRLNERGYCVASETLELALVSAVEASRATHGLCDPTVLPSLLALGYDDDFERVARREAPAPPRYRPAPGASAIWLDEDSHRVVLARGCQVDLGAIAKALAADLVADDVEPTGGVLVEIGGDVAVRGAGPLGPWSIGVSESLRVADHAQRVSIPRGGIATSSSTARAWRMGDRTVHHIVDPRTGEPARGPYVTATVSAESCVRANAFATAALIWGEDAPYHLAQSRCAARLVRDDGTREYVGGWPADEVAA